jgi:hypothetical protein
MRRLHHFLRDERGVSLTELMVAVFMLTVVSVIFTTVLVSSMQATRDLQGAALSNDNVRLVLQTLDRELRGAERICEPSAGVAANRLEFRTRAFAGTAPAAGYRDVIYELRDDGTGALTVLQRSADGGATWRTVVENVRNVEMGDDIFANQGDETTALPSQGKVVTVRIWVDADPADRIAAELATTEISGRNIWTPNNTGC